ncbi:MAG TPA: class I SAM-dependent methyltransferase [Thermodesulfovibrionales bacterium]|nr:class I SAM-dependent methyltransferase [Thermodesulfovibrionales bacterium]
MRSKETVNHHQADLEITMSRGTHGMRSRRCRFCGSGLHVTFVDLGVSPLANSFLRADELGRMEAFYPLHTYVCEHCFLVQLEAFQTPEHMFGDYVYFSSYSDTWLRHAEEFTNEIMARYALTGSSQVIEIASNDGYLLQYFQQRGVSVLGIEPAANVAEAAIGKGIPTLVEFFGAKTAEKLSSQGIKADVLIGNNVLAHVPDLKDFVLGMKVLLKGNGVITIEFPHLMRLIEDSQFDTIYHEHFSYFSFGTVLRIFSDQGLTVFDVEELKTHGGSLRVYARHTEDKTKPVTGEVKALEAREDKAGLTNLEYYRSFGEKVKEAKRAILDVMIKIKRAGKTIVGYGAAAKGNTLLNYCGIRSDFLDYVVDRNPHKQGKYLPGTRVPIHHPDKIRETKPDILLIIPWNLRDEITEQMSHLRSWGGRFLVLIPEIRVF